MCIVIDGKVVNEGKSFLEAKVGPSSVIEIYKKLKQCFVTVNFRGQTHEFVVCENCLLQQVVMEVLVTLLSFF